MKPKVIAEMTVGLFLLCMVGTANATLYTEDFEADFPVWENGWLGKQTNIQNYYGKGQGRGNNPDGLWMSDGLDNGDQAEISFLPSLGADVTDFSIDITTWVKDAKFIAWNMNYAVIKEIAITSFYGAWNDPGDYQTISLTGLDGMSGFSIVGGWIVGSENAALGGGWIEGNTAIDNIIINTNAAHAPEPATMLLFGTGLAGLGILTRNRKRRN